MNSILHTFVSTSGGAQLAIWRCAPEHFWSGLLSKLKIHQAANFCKVTSAIVVSAWSGTPPKAQSSILLIQSVRSCNNISIIIYSIIISITLLYIPAQSTVSLWRSFLIAAFYIYTIFRCSCRKQLSGGRTATEMLNFTFGISSWRTLMKKTPCLLTVSRNIMHQSQ